MDRFNGIKTNTVLNKFADNQNTSFPWILQNESWMHVLAMSSHASNWKS